MAKKNLKEAKEKKVDEFYTQIEDIEKELFYYEEYFRGKVVLCNCDDPYESNFFKYFALNFNYLGLKKLIATCHNTSPIAGQQISLFDFIDSDGNIDVYNTPPVRAYKIEIKEVKEKSTGAYDLSDVEYLIKNKKNVLTLLDGDGDFRSAECLSLLQEADIVCTNPPFSLFREYISTNTFRSDSSIRWFHDNIFKNKYNRCHYIINYWFTFRSPNYILYR